MIRESLYFTFNNRRSSDFGILNVSISGGLYEEPFLSNRSIQETTVRGNEKPYFNEIRREPKQFSISFAFEETWNDELIDEVAEWLDVEYYQPLTFSEKFERVFYALPVDSSSLVHNGLKQGYVTLTFRCNSPYSYSHVRTTQWYDLSENVTFKNIEFMNEGNAPIKPEIFIQKITDGDISIENYSNGEELFKFTELSNNEIIQVNCDNEIIETNLANTYRYDNFNDNYLTLSTGRNLLQVTGKCKIMFRYQLKYR